MCRPHQILLHTNIRKKVCVQNTFGVLSTTHYSSYSVELAKCTACSIFKPTIDFFSGKIAMAERVHYSECKKKRGVVIESKKIVKINTETTTEKAAELITDSVTKYWIKEVLETDGDELESLAFGKAYIETKQGRSVSESDSWKLSGFQSPMKSKTFQNTSLIVVATIEGRDHDAYAMSLCDKLPVSFAPGKYNVKPHPTRAADGKEASCVYMGFFIKGRNMHFHYKSSPKQLFCRQG